MESVAVGLAPAAAPRLGGGRSAAQQPRRHQRGLASNGGGAGARAEQYGSWFAKSKRGKENTHKNEKHTTSTTITTHHQNNRKGGKWKDRRTTTLKSVASCAAVRPRLPSPMAPRLPFVIAVLRCAVAFYHALSCVKVCDSVSSFVKLC